ncbi:30S ribosomal protein S10 [Candidatus Micrarchaeota archaeon]|nr:30S ribosomal protein S10 [Candidatus Micrarchaeota archaeon]
MVSKARICIIGKDISVLNSICDEITSLAKTKGIAVKGPVPFPTKKIKVRARKSPCGDGSETYEHWEMRIHKRIIEIPGDEAVLRQLMRVRVPDTVKVRIILIEPN